MLSGHLMKSLKEKWRAPEELKVNVIDFDRPEEDITYLPHYLYLLTPEDVGTTSDESKTYITILPYDSYNYKIQHDLVELEGIRSVSRNMDLLDIFRTSKLVVVDSPYDMISAMATKTNFIVVSNNKITLTMAERYCPDLYSVAGIDFNDWVDALNKLLSRKVYNRKFPIVDTYRKFIYDINRWDTPWKVLYDKSLEKAILDNDHQLITLTYLYYKEDKKHLIELLMNNNQLFHNIKLKKYKR